MLTVPPGNQALSLSLAGKVSGPCIPFLYPVCMVGDEPTPPGEPACADDADLDTLPQQNEGAPPSHYVAPFKSPDPPKKRHCRSVSTPCCYETASRRSHHSGSGRLGGGDQLHFRVIHPHPHTYREVAPRERHYSGDAAHFYRERHLCGEKKEEESAVGRMRIQG
ncbi:PREDICTED: uncharacterized protein LOC106808414 [Priapulus caudatus]|uniref:Uncharacterized protein LOC106808414 n=1 Tax=Priapulus caudatus TaxID=37621 RepID=A0ABM1E349_PRICU|nr:PREDICTED: uncharacterized protein LOC106808414 [Priapulus caudatus]